MFINHSLNSQIKWIDFTTILNPTKLHNGNMFRFCSGFLFIGFFNQYSFRLGQSLIPKRPGKPQVLNHFSYFNLEDQHNNNQACGLSLNMLLYVHIFMYIFLIFKSLCIS